MDLLNGLEIYIPLEAEVKNVPLQSLPKSVLRRMSLPSSDREGSRALADSPQSVWICPVVIRVKGQKATTQTVKSAKENMTSLLGAGCHTSSGPFRMSFVCANRAAYKVLKETMPGTTVSHTQQTSLIPGGLVPHTHQDAVVVNHGRIYLSIRKASRKGETRHPQPAAQMSRPSTSAQSHNRKKEDIVSQQSQPERRFQRKREQVTVPGISAKKHQKDVSSTDVMLTEPELHMNKTSTCKEAANDNKEDVCDKGRDTSSSKAARSVPHSTDSIHTVDGQRPAAGEVDLEPPGFQPRRDQDHNEEEEEAGKHSNEYDMHELPDQSHSVMDTYVQFGDYDQSSNQSWSRRESAFVQQEVDFKALEQEERIARMKAKLRQSEAALSSLQAPK